ncbi:MAG TPA: pyridoxamine 5'-phosphate oxidase [Acidothermaceae bacterium]|jgi:pyridoxamine 5'-phosphate oxidase
MDADAVARLREYHYAVGLDESDLAADPITQFDAWLRELTDLEVPEPNAMVLSTVDAEGQPSSRHVLLKGVDDGGFVFFTNYGSRKGRELAANPRASLCFPWFCIGRQVIVAGVVTKVTDAETEEYFASRARASQLGAWASEHQSAVVADRAALDVAYAEVAARYGGLDPVPTPPFWGGFRVTPSTIEFWQGRNARLHDRLRYRRPDDDAGGKWIVERLSP